MAKKKANPAKRGKKNFYETLHIRDKLDSIRGWCMNGSLDLEICKMLGISKDTFYKWKREHYEFAEGVKRG